MRDQGHALATTAAQQEPEQAERAQKRGGAARGAAAALDQGNGTGLVPLGGAALRLLGSDVHGALSVGAALFLAAPLARNAVVLTREQRRAPRLLAVVGTALLLAVYAYAAWMLWRVGGE